MEGTFVALVYQVVIPLTTIEITFGLVGQGDDYWIYSHDGRWSFSIFVQRADGSLRVRVQSRLQE